MEDWQIRVIQERDDLESKLAKLAQFLSRASNQGPSCLHEYPQYGHSNLDSLLNRQYDTMLNYHQLLTQRICLFKE